MAVKTDADKGQKHRDYMRERRRVETKAGQDIGMPPPVKNWERRNACRYDLPLFLKTYLAHQFPLPFSPDHFIHLGKAQTAVLESGLFAQAAPRGDGKTERTKGTALWAILNGHRRFVLMIGATASGSDELLDGWRYYIESAATIVRNKAGEFVRFEPGLFPLLAEDFPEAVYPVLALEGETRRQGGQRIGDIKTDIHWGGSSVTMPTVPPGNWIDGVTIGPAPSAGALIRVSSITGRLRGFNVNGMRPDLVLPDDPQTDESAASPAGNAKLERILASAVIGLAGPGKRISGIMPCTVIRRGDAIDNILNHELHPEWDSMRTKLVYAFPNRLERSTDAGEPSWEEYRDIRYNYNPDAENDKKRADNEATEYYRQHQAKLSEGATIAWEHRFAAGEVDAIQHAMNLYFQDRAAFYAEYQNDPLAENLGNVVELTPDDIVSRLNRIPRGVVPLDASTLTAFVDVQAHLLFWMVCGWRANFTGWVIDYGVWPKQGRPYFTKADASHTLARQYPDLHSEEAQLKQGLTDLLAAICGGEWRGENGAVRVERVLVDSGYQAKVVYEVVRRSPYGGILLPSKGEFVGAGSKKGVGEGKINPGDRRGLNWILPAAKEERGVKLLRFDTNAWKSFVHARLAVLPHLPESLSLFGDDKQTHRMLADHLTAEYRDRVKSERTGREVDEWTLKPGRPDNDWLDCLVGCTVAAAMQGIVLEGVHQATPPRKKPQRVSFAEMQQRAREARAG